MENKSSDINNLTDDQILESFRKMYDRKEIKDGEHITFHDYTNAIYSRGTYVNGKEEGYFYFYHCDGELFNKVFYVNGKEEGEYITYWPNGKWQHKGTYVNGKLEGEYKETRWYSDKVSFQGNYVKGRRDGLFVSYDEEGNISSRGLYKNGVLEPGMEFDDKVNMFFSVDDKVRGWVTVYSDL